MTNKFLNIKFKNTNLILYLCLFIGSLLIIYWIYNYLILREGAEYTEFADQYITSEGAGRLGGKKYVNQISACATTCEEDNSCDTYVYGQWTPDIINSDCKKMSKYYGVRTNRAFKGGITIEGEAPSLPREHPEWGCLTDISGQDWWRTNCKKADGQVDYRGSLLGCGGVEDTSKNWDPSIVDSSCQVMADFYGIEGTKHFGCLPNQHPSVHHLATQWWLKNCNKQKAASGMKTGPGCKAPSRPSCENAKFIKKDLDASQNFYTFIEKSVLPDPTPVPSTCPKGCTNTMSIGDGNQSDPFPYPDGTGCFVWNKYKCSNNKLLEDGTENLSYSPTGCDTYYIDPKTQRETYRTCDISLCGFSQYQVDTDPSNCPALKPPGTPLPGAGRIRKCPAGTIITGDLPNTIPGVAKPGSTGKGFADLYKDMYYHKTNTGPQRCVDKTVDEFAEEWNPISYIIQAIVGPPPEPPPGTGACPVGYDPCTGGVITPLTSDCYTTTCRPPPDPDAPRDSLGRRPDLPQRKIPTDCYRTNSSQKCDSSRGNCARGQLFCGDDYPSPCQYVSSLEDCTGDKDPFDPSKFDPYPGGGESGDGRGGSGGDDPYSHDHDDDGSDWHHYYPPGEDEYDEDGNYGPEGNNQGPYGPYPDNEDYPGASGPYEDDYDYPFDETPENYFEDDDGYLIPGSSQYPHKPVPIPPKPKEKKISAYNSIWDIF